MESFASKSSVTQRALRYLAVCLVTSMGFACASDDSDSAQEEEGQTATEEKDAKSDKDAKDSNERDEASEGEGVGPDATPEAAAKRDEAANPGSSAVTRFDGNWEGKTEQGTPVRFKILNRFLAHMEVGYKLEGDNCKAEEGLVKLSAMNPSRMGAFMLMTTTETEKLTVSGKFDGDDDASGEYSVELTGDAPEGCNNTVSGTWKATK